MLQRHWFSACGLAATAVIWNSGVAYRAVVALRDSPDALKDSMEMDLPEASSAVQAYAMKRPNNRGHDASHEVSNMHPVLAQLAGTPFSPGVIHGTAARQWMSSLVKGSESHTHYTKALQKPQNHTVLTKMPWDEGVAPLVQCKSSVQLKETDAQSEADKMLYNATKTFCDAGLGELVEFFVHPAFQANFDRLKDEDGWINKAYVTYMGLKADEDKTAGEEYMLVQSVHHFSDYPVLATNFNDRVPEEWTAEAYPNLVLLQGHSTKDIKKSFNFNKFTSMLFTKVKSGMVLDADQFVNTGVDSMLERAAEETTKDYPYAIMPVHWMSKDPEAEDGYKVYAWHFKSKSAPKQTLRWGHAHPTWSFHALPWLAKWSTMFLAQDNPETQAPAWLKEQGFMEDEDLLNVALWATPGATKQWCKYDVTAPNDFTYFLKQDGIGNYGRDSKYYPKGIPLVFFTAHNAKNPDESYSYLKELWEGKDERKAIQYDKHWFKSNAELKAYDPTVKCIV